MKKGYKVYKRDIESILFSNLKKEVNRLNKWIFWLVFSETLISLFLIDFTTKNDTMGSVWFGLSFFYCSLYTITGYSWFSKMKMNNTNGKKWLIGMAIAGFLHLPLKFAFAASGISYMLVPLLIYVIVFMVHSFLKIQNSGTSDKPWLKWIDLMISGAFLLMVLLGIMFMSSSSIIGRMTIGLMVILFLIVITLVIVRFIYKDKGQKLFLIDSSSIIFLSLATLSAAVIWAIKVLAFNFFFGGLAIGVCLLQLLLAYFAYRLMKKDKDEYESNFIKAFIFNLALLGEIILIVISKEGQQFIGDKNQAHFMNIVVAGMAISFLIYKYIKFNITRRKLYKVIDVFAISSIVAAIISLSILQNMGIFNGVQELDIDELVLYSSSGLIGINIIASLFDWAMTLTDKHKEKTWI